MNRLIFFEIAITAVLSLAGCSSVGSSSQLHTTWRDPTAGPISFKKVAVVMLNSTAGERRAQEDELVRQIKRATAVASYTLVPNSDLANREKVKATITQQGFDGAVVGRTIDETNPQTYVPGSTSYWYDGLGYEPYTRTPGYYVSNRIIWAEVSVYSVADGKLLWVGSSTTSNPDTAKDLAIQVAKAAGAELKKQGLIE